MSYSSQLLHSIHITAFPNGWSAEAFRDMLSVPGTVALVEEREGQAAGFILYRVQHEQCEILTLAVLPQLQRQGIGAQLVEKAQAAAKHSGAQTIFLEVAEKNTAALRLYEKCGFTCTRTRKDYYKNADGSYSNAVVMEWRSTGN